MYLSAPVFQLGCCCIMLLFGDSRHHYSKGFLEKTLTSRESFKTPRRKLELTVKLLGPWTPGEFFTGALGLWHFGKFLIIPYNSKAPNHQVIIYGQSIIQVLEIGGRDYISIIEGSNPL